MIKQRQTCGVFNRDVMLQARDSGRGIGAFFALEDFHVGMRLMKSHVSAEVTLSRRLEGADRAAELEPLATFFFLDRLSSGGHRIDADLRDDIVNQS